MDDDSQGSLLDNILDPTDSMDAIKARRRVAEEKLASLDAYRNEKEDLMEGEHDSEYGGVHRYRGMITSI